MTATGLANLGLVAQKQKKFKSAEPYLEEGLAIFKEIGNRRGIANLLANLGHCATDQGDVDAAWRYYGDALGEGAAIGFAALVFDALAGVARLLVKAGKYVHAAELLGMIFHHPAVVEQTRTESTPPLAVVRETLPADQLDAALERGKELNLDTVVAEILDEFAGK